VRKLNVTPSEAKLLDALCELGETDLVARKTGWTERTVEVYLARLIKKVGYPNRLTLALAWDREHRDVQK
jgi:DNA-binding NarL/FixJ family response regulator